MDDSSSPWEEALDVDDSDFPSLLRPCKRRHHQTTVGSQPILLTPSSQLSQTLASPSQHLTSLPPPPAPLRLIPGPAGAIQAAMLRKARDSRDLAADESPVPTQEYIRRAVEDPEEDDDFKGNPWGHAIDFLIKTDGRLDGLVPSIPLNDVMERLNMGKAHKVVAVIKSCVPNGLGDFTVTLKDPMGTMGASIHGKIFTESDFGKEISVGSVLILQNVSVFSPTRSAHYLVITLKNIVKVFPKESGSQLRQNSCVPTVKYAPPGNEYSEKATTVEKSISREPRRSKDLMSEMTRKYGNEVNLCTINQKEKGSTSSGKGNRNVVPAEAVGLDENELGSQGNYKVPNESSIECMKTAATNLVEKSSGGKEAEGIEKQWQPLISRASLPKWTATVEELEELFDMD